MKTPLPMEFSRHSLKVEVNGNVVAIYFMSKPSDLPSAYRPSPSKLPIARLDLKEKGANFQFEVMHNVRHPNILRLEAIKEMEVGGQTVLAAFVEPHNGLLITCLKKQLAHPVTRALPSQSFRELVRQMVFVVEELRINGLYHGDLSIKNIYYAMERDAMVIKLANFLQKPEEIGLETAQLLDLVGLGRVLGYISDGAKSLDANFSCLVIDHLALKLQALTDIASLPNLKEEILGDPFFWDPRKRTNFYIHDIPNLLKDPNFVARVKKYIYWQLPWDTNTHNGLIAAMNDHRVNKLKMAAYNGMDPVANLRCMSGAYTHQDDLEGKLVDRYGNRLSVDECVQINQPKLTIILYGIMTGEFPDEDYAAVPPEAAAVPPGGAAVPPGAAAVQ